MLLNIIFVLILQVTLSVPGSSSKCEIPISSKDREHYRLQWPLVFTKSGGELFDTNLSKAGAIQVTIDEDAEVLLSCGPNYFKKFYKIEVLTATCNGATGNFTIKSKGGSNIVEGTEMNIKELTCDLRVIEEVLIPVKGCSDDENRLTSSSFGYLDPLEQVSLVLGEACYDTAAGVTLWAHIKLGRNAAAGYLQKADKSFLTAHQHPDGRYKIDLFRGLHFDELYERIRSQLHTTATPALKISNYVNDPLLNNAQFQAVKKLGWNYFVSDDDLHVLDTLREDIQSLSGNIDLELYVGAHNVLKLEGSGGEVMELYLHAAPKIIAEKTAQTQRFPVPSLVWLMVRHQNKATVFGVFNNAAISKEEIQRRAMCKSVCEQMTWLLETNKLNASERAPLICCSHAEWVQAVKGFPKHLEGINEYLL